MTPAESARQQIDALCTLLGVEVIWANKKQDDMISYTALKNIVHVNNLVTDYLDYDTFKRAVRIFCDSSDEYNITICYGYGTLSEDEKGNFLKKMGYRNVDRNVRRLPNSGMA